MNDQRTPLCGSVRDVLPCLLTEDHGGMHHEDTNGYRWPTVTEEPDAAHDGACSLCDVVKPSAYALRDHVMNVHPGEFCGIYHDHPAATPAVTKEPGR
ncbi:hypothetical protein [Streptomyces sp. NPDC005989]|uniref:hypothetical protein n=1 Tax=Streptomyces sp. NPDC005989 TaxID=3156727 RepID=UPI0033DBE2AD